MQAVFSQSTNTLELGGRHIKLNSNVFTLARKDRLSEMLSSWLVGAKLTQCPVEVLVR